MSRGAGPIVTELFVYGTLKQGECRDSLWPRKPLRVRDAFVLGRLYDLGAYPAIRVDGEAMENEEWRMENGDQYGDQRLDWVGGEVWSFEVDDVLATIARLDEIEETNQRGYHNLYDHVLVRVHDRPNSRSSRLALVYQYSSAGRLDHSPRLRPRDGELIVSWSGYR